MQKNFHFAFGEYRKKSRYLHQQNNTFNHSKTEVKMLSQINTYNNAVGLGPIQALLRSAFNS